MITLRGVTFAYGPGPPVLKVKGLEVGKGLTLLLGPNGCGKSTLLKLAAGIEQPDTGEVRIGGRDLWKEEVAARRHLAYVPEHPELTPYATLSEILELVAALRGESLQAAKEAIHVTGLDGLSGRSVRELSAGQRRRAILAAAMIGRPQVILLDEPLESMDRGMREEILHWVARHDAAGCCIVVVTHDVLPFIRLASRALTLKAGEPILEETLPPDTGTRQALLESMARGEA